jgi:hypothetical protein
MVVAREGIRFSVYTRVVLDFIGAELSCVNDRTSLLEMTFDVKAGILSLADSPFVDVVRFPIHYRGTFLDYPPDSARSR